MKIKRILAVAAAALLIIGCFVSCRTKDEAAYSFTYQGKTVDIKTGLYMCFLLEADMTFQNEAVEKANADGTKYKDYTELKYENKDYETWTKDKAKELAGKYAYSEIEFERFGYTISDDEESYLDSYAEQYWSNIQEVYEKNGISYNTYKDFFVNIYLKQDMVYNFYIQEAKDEHDHDHETTPAASTAKGETTTTVQTTTEKKLDPEVEKLKGSLRPEDAKINTALSKNFVAVNMIDLSYTDESGNKIGDDTKKTYKEKLNNYAEKLKKGTDFAKVYSEYKKDFNVTDDSSSGTTTDSYDKVLMSAAANKASNSGDEASENFNNAYKMKVGEVKVFESDDCISLIVRKNILKDKNSSSTSYKDNYTSSAIDVIVKDNYEKNIVDKAVSEMKVKENSSAVKFYSPKKIDYLNDTTTAQTSYAAQ